MGRAAAANRAKVVPRAEGVTEIMPVASSAWRRARQRYMVIMQMKINIESADAPFAPHEHAPGAGLDPARMPAHWLLARLGKRVLRPGGRETTAWLLDEGAVSADDDVVELAPGMGATAALLLARRPRSYVGVERDPAAAAAAERAVQRSGHGGARIAVGDAASVPLGDGAASLVLGEAMLSMAPEAQKRRIVADAARVLRSGGRYLVHELAFEGTEEARAAAERDMSQHIHVGVRIHDEAGWRALLTEAGLSVRKVRTGPMHLLEPGRVLSDEGLARAALFLFRLATEPRARARVLEVRRCFRRHAAGLRSIALVADKP